MPHQSKWNELKDWITETLGLTRKYGDLEVGMSIVLKKMYDLDKEEEKRNERPLGKSEGLDF